jgi:hypothetical protein
MRFLIALILIAAGVAGVGFYRGWFHVTSDTSTGERSVTVTVDEDKIQQDKNEAQKKAQNLKQN